MAAGLTEMRGATAPRLLLELICARVLLPGADHSTDGLTAPLDRIEKRMSVSGLPASAPARPQTQVPAQDRPAPASSTRAPDQVAEAPAGAAVAPSATAPHAEPAPEPVPSPAPVASQPAAQPDPQPAAHPSPPPETPPQETPPRSAPAPTQQQAPQQQAAASTPEPGALSLVEVRRLWPDIVEATKVRRRVTWIHLTQNAQVVAVDAKTLTLGFANAGARDSFDGNGSAEIVRQAAIDVVGSDWRIETIVDPGASPDTAPVVTRQAAPAAPPAEPAASPVQPQQPQQAQQPQQPQQQGAPEGQPGPLGQPPVPETPAPAQERPPAWLDEAPPDDDPGEPGTPPPDASPTAPAAPAQRPQAGPGSIAAARGAIQQTRVGGADIARSDDLRAADADAHPDDLDADDETLGGAALLERELGARVIEEIRHQ